MIENQELAYGLIEKMETLLEVSKMLADLIQNADVKGVSMLVENMEATLTEFVEVSDSLKKEEEAINLYEASLSIQKSLALIWSDYSKKNKIEQVIKKIKYEMIPLIEEMRANFYFWGCIYPDQKKMDHYYQKEIYEHYHNTYLEYAQATGIYPYEVSIIVVGYNKLDYTRMCVESLLRFIPKDLEYELILVDHGSNDGTKEYFESIEPDKQLDIAVNGGGASAVYRICEGRYSLHISNDVLLTPNAIENMLHCMRSDENIAWVVPSTSNVANYQTILLPYHNNMEQLEIVAKINNQRDPFRWEQRVRLCNPIDLKRNEAFYKTQAANYPFSKTEIAFPDDKISLLLRRNGYKLMLAKDAYCHHFGSVTLKEEFEKQDEEKLYLQVRESFQDAFQIDPWGKGRCYDPALFKILPCERMDSVRILGINAGMGSNPLKIKEALKENVHNTDCKLYNYTMELAYAKDLKGISDELRTLSSWADFETCNQGLDFDYILIEDYLENRDDVQERISIVTKYLKEGGFLVIRLATDQLASWCEQVYSAMITVMSESTDYWAIIKN